MSSGLTEASTEVKDETSEKDESNINHVNNLMPAELLTLKMKVKGESIEGLIDTGASKCLVKNKWIGSDKVERCPTKSIKGIGGQCIKVIGEYLMRIEIGGVYFEWKCLVVSDDDISYDLIIGSDFICHHLVKIDMKRRMINLRRADKVGMRFIVDEDGEVKDIMADRVPVYCKDKIKVHANHVSQVPVEFENLSKSSKDIENKVYFEASHPKFQAFDGVMSDKDVNSVWLQGKKTGSIPKGEILGYVNTMITVDEQVGEIETMEDWSVEKMEQEIKLGDNLSAEQKVGVRKLLMEWKLALSTGDSDIGKADIEPIKIEVSRETPIWQKPRNFSQPVNDEIERQCSELLANDILDYSTSNWSSPVCPVRKPDGSLRLCIDYRQVNKVITKEEYPMPNLNKCIYRPGKVKFFTTLDLVRGYYQLPIEKSSRKYTAFCTQQHQYEWKRLSFGLRNSGMAFQRVMQQILSPLLHNNIIIYIDDICIMSETYEEHIELVGKVLALLAKYNIKVNVKKCEWFKEEVVFLGHIINGQGIKKSPEFVQKVIDVEKPTTVKQLRKFIGLINFGRKFIRNCSLMTQPLTECLKGKNSKKLVWTTEMDQAFVQLKEAVREEVMLAYPDYSKGASKMELFVDASGSGCGSALLQKQHGETRIIAYGSRTFSDTERRYSATDREMAAIRWGVNHFRCFLSGVAFILVTDHRPLVFLESMATSSNSRLMRTVEELADMDFEIQYRPGKDNTAADFLSRVNGSQQTVQEEMADYKYLPPGVIKVCDVQGGGDSMLESLIIVLREGKQYYDYGGDVPDDPKELRELLVDEVSRNMKEYGLVNGKQVRQRLKMMRKEGQQPMAELLLAASRLYGLAVHVYCGMKEPVIFVYDNQAENFIVRLQCVSMVHYNLLCVKGRMNEEIRQDYVNMVVTRKTEDVNLSFDDTEEIELEELTEKTECNHCVFHTAVASRGFPGRPFCCVLDTGAQVSLVSERVLHEMKKAGKNVEIQNSPGELVSVNKTRSVVLGYVDLKLDLKDIECRSCPFGVVKEEDLPTCFLIGANFLILNDIELDIGRNKMVFNNVEQSGIEEYLINSAFISENDEVDYVLGASISESSESEVSGMEEPHESLEELIPKYIVNERDLVEMQKRNFAINNLRGVIKKGIKPKSWKLKAIHQFRRSAKSLKFKGNLLVKEEGQHDVVVVSMQYMVEIVAKTHKSMNHVGRHKVFNAIKHFFWHPGLDQLCLDYCKSCGRCQRMKTHRMDKVPPVKKISTSRPFEMLCIDLLKYPRSRRGNEYMLVCIDHFSKWLAIQPIRNKDGKTVANNFKYNILPNLPRIPEKVLSDNGSEFTGRKFKKVLKEQNIFHCYSSAYHAAGNGCVERVNRSTIQLLKGDVEEGKCWDEKLYKAVITYNNSIHSETKMTPSQCLLMKNHDVKHRFPASSEVIGEWKQGNPKFCSFKVGQKVLRKINRIGTLLAHKLQDRFEGPYVVTRVFTNELSYEIKEETTGKRWKVNHRQLKVWHEIPRYILRHMQEGNPVSSAENKWEIDAPKDSEKVTLSVSISSSESDSEPHSKIRRDQVSVYAGQTNGPIYRGAASDTDGEFGTQTVCREPKPRPDNCCIPMDEASELMEVHENSRAPSKMMTWAQVRNQSLGINKVNVSTREAGKVKDRDREVLSNGWLIEQQRLVESEFKTQTIRRLEEELQLTRRQMKTLEQRLIVCDEMAQEMVESLNIDVGEGFDDAILTSTVTLPEQNVKVLHSTPKHSFMTVSTVGLGGNLGDGNSIQISQDVEEQVTLSNGEEASEAANTGNTIPSLLQSYRGEFSGFSQAEILSRNLMNDIDLVMMRLNNLCSAGQIERSESNRSVPQLINESEDLVGELPSPREMTFGLRRSKRKRRPPDRYIPNGK